MSDIKVKICGLKTPEHIRAATDAGAAYVGFVFIPKSKRYIPTDLARDLTIDVKLGVAKVALVLDANDVDLDRIVNTVPLDMLQLHGSESPERVAAIKARYGLPVMKAIGIAQASDVAMIDEYIDAADQILVDTKPTDTKSLPGGTGQTFDWGLIAGRRWTKPWMLAGGLTTQNVAEAIKISGTKQVDLSSAVESAPGVKDSGLIKAFMQAALA